MTLNVETKIDIKRCTRFRDKVKLGEDLVSRLQIICTLINRLEIILTIILI